MNALVCHIEKQDDTNFMSSAHGFFSLGGAIGAVLGSFLMGFFLNPVYHMILTASCVILINMRLSKHYFHITESVTSKEKKKFQLKSLSPLLIIAFLAFVIMSSEGAIEHWSTLYLIEVVEITERNLAGLGFILFSTAMTIGRFFGDGISAKRGSIKVILLGCLVASMGYLCVLLNMLVVTVIGFGLVGLGLSVIVPELFRIAGNTKDVSASAGISFVSGIGFVGFLLGPVVLGFISDSYSLKTSFLTLLVLTVFAFIVSFSKFKLETTTS